MYIDTHTRTHTYIHTYIYIYIYIYILYVYITSEKTKKALCEHSRLEPDACMHV